MPLKMYRISSDTHLLIMSGFSLKKLILPLMDFYTQESCGTSFLWHTKVLVYTAVMNYSTCAATRFILIGLHLSSLTQ